MSTKKTKNYTIGLDIGGTTIKGILFDGENVIADHELGTPKDNLEHFLVMLKAVVDPLLAKAEELKVKVSGIGLGVAGVIDYSESRMLVSPNIEIINNVKLVEKIQGIYDLPVIIDNDGNCFIRAEVMLGAARNRNNAYGVIIGTGIGGGWWINGSTYQAEHGGSGEPGEMIIDFSEPVMLEEAYHKLTQGNPGAVAEEAYRGDILAGKTYEEIGDFLGIAFANIINIIAPDIIVVGGGVTESSNLFLARTKKAMKKYIASPILKKRVKIVKAKLGVHAGAIGAALLIK
jgi:predicted NBD/HSP70 family sugar kinase